MPTPNKKESKKDYIQRCVPIVLDEGTAKDSKQAVAICSSMWEQDKKKKKNRAKALLEEVAAVLAEKNSNGKD